MPTSRDPRASPAWNKLFPLGVATVTQAELAGEPQLMPEERQFVARAVPARVLEFAAGRSCARAALARFGCPPVALPVGAKREPKWPPGFIGSITHCPGHCAAAVARLDFEGPHPIASIGLDAEPAQALPDEVAAMVLCGGERHWINRNGQNQLPWDRLVFSAKESVFKCLFPVEQRYMDFARWRSRSQPKKTSRFAHPAWQQHRSMYMAATPFTLVSL